MDFAPRVNYLDRSEDLILNVIEEYSSSMGPTEKWKWQAQSANLPSVSLKRKALTWLGLE